MQLRILCVHIETSSLWAEFVNKNRCISVRLISEDDKSIKFWSFWWFTYSFPLTRIFHWFFMWKMDPMSGLDIRLVFTLPPRDSTLQYKRCEHLWNNFSCITSLVGKIILYFQKWEHILFWMLVLILKVKTVGI